MPTQSSNNHIIAHYNNVYTCYTNHNVVIPFLVVHYQPTGHKKQSINLQNATKHRLSLYRALQKHSFEVNNNSTALITISYM